MNHTKYTIIWEKWKDPLGYDDQEDTISPLLNQEDINLEENDLEPQESVINKKIRCHMISTPFGIIPFNENTASSEIFNFWTGHSNFAITLKIASIIENVDGVETLNVFTKYRFRIAVGKAFVDSEVMRNINNQIYEYMDENND